MRGSYFVVELKIVSVIDHYCAQWVVLFLCEFQLFLHRFLLLIASLQGTEVVLSLCTSIHTTVLLLLRDRHASSCLVAVPPEVGGTPYETDGDARQKF